MRTVVLSKVVGVCVLLQMAGCELVGSVSTCEESGDDGFTIEFYTDECRFFEAREFCQDLDGELASIRSDAEFETVQNFLHGSITRTIPFVFIDGFCEQELDCRNIANFEHLDDSPKVVLPFHEESELDDSRDSCLALGTFNESDAIFNVDCNNIYDVLCRFSC